MNREMATAILLFLHPPIGKGYYAMALSVHLLVSAR